MLCENMKIDVLVGFSWFFKGNTNEICDRT